MSEESRPEFNREEFLNRDNTGRITGINHHRFSNAIIEKYHFKTIKDTEELLYYCDGYYCDNGEKMIKKLTEETFTDINSKRTVSEIIAHVQRSTYIERKIVNGNPWILNLENGLFNIENQEFTPHNSDYVITARIPVEYDPDAKCPTIDKFLSEIVQPEDAEAIYEMIGYTLYRGYPIHTFFIFLGSGNNGKTTLINLLVAFVGERNTSHIPLQKLGEFHIQNLFGKMLNSVGDLNATEIRRAGDLKQVTGEDMIDAFVKFQNKPISLKNYAKLVYSCNELPATNDKSAAFYQRSRIIDFMNKFTKETEDAALPKKMTTQEELSGLFNVAVIHLKRLLERKGFTGELTIEEKRCKWEEASNPIYRFINSFYLKNVEGYSNKQETRRSYISYCEMNGVPMESEKSFQKILLDTFPYIGDAQRGGEGDSKPSWTGIIPIDEGQKIEGGGDFDDLVEEAE